MAENKRYYWLKLKEDFFDDDTIEWIEEQENGKAYCLFYLKLCLKSLKSDGVLMRTVGEMLIPYDTKSIASMTKTDPDTVRVAMQLFARIGLVKILENGEIYMAQLKELVGSETDKAALMRKKRAKISDGNNVTPLLPECYTEYRDKELRDKEKEIDNNRSSDDDHAPDPKPQTKSKVEQEFDTLWKLYPRREGRKKAFSSYERARKHGTTFDQVKNGIEEYKNKIERDRTDKQYVKQGSTWFNGECWNDDYSDAARSGAVSKWQRDTVLIDPDALPF